MNRTVVLKLCVTDEQSAALFALQKEYIRVCNTIAPVAARNRCWNHPDLHRLTYYPTRVTSTLGSQLVCNAIKAVCNAYKVLKIKREDTVPLVDFKPHRAVHFDKRTYSFIEGVLSLYTLAGRILVPFALGEFQQTWLKQGVPKEAELVYRKKKWYFNLVVSLPDVPLRHTLGNTIGVDVGVNVLAVTSTGKFFSGNLLKDSSDRTLALHSRLQSNGSKSSKQLLQKISGKQARRTKQTNHQISKAIVAEASAHGCDTIALEDLTHIGKNFKGTKQTRIRLYRWSRRQLLFFIQYKAEAAGIKVVLVNPRNTSKKCATCGRLGKRKKHRFVCEFCGIRRHADLNASLNIRKIAQSADCVTGTVNYPNVAAIS